LTIADRQRSKHERAHKNLQRIQEQRAARKRLKEESARARGEKTNFYTTNNPKLKEEMLKLEKREKRRTQKIERALTTKKRGIAPTRSEPTMPTTNAWIKPTEAVQRPSYAMLKQPESNQRTSFSSQRQSFSSQHPSSASQQPPSFSSEQRPSSAFQDSFEQELMETTISPTIPAELLDEEAEEDLDLDEPIWKRREAAKHRQAQLDRQTMLKRELSSLPKHQLQIIDGFPNYPWNNYPYRADPETGFSLWPLQGMQGQKTPIRNAPFATASNEQEWKGWKTMKDDMFDPIRDGRCLPAKSMKDLCSPYRE
jgi:hypothetical protein